MLLQLKKILLLLGRRQKASLMKLVALSVIMSFTELLSVASIIPFMQVLASPEVINDVGYLKYFYEKSGSNGLDEFLIIAAVLVISIIFLSSFFSIFATWKISIIGSELSSYISSRLFHNYMKQSWLYHTATNSSILISKVSQEAQRVSAYIIIPFVNAISKTFLVLFIISAILFYNPFVAIVSAFIFGGSYVFIFKLVKGRLIRSGLETSELQEERMKLMSEGFGGIRDFIIQRNQYFFIDRFEKVTEKYFRSMGRTQALSMMPRYIIEFVAFGGVVFLILLLMLFEAADIKFILPFLAFYGISGMKILPAAQQIYAAIANAKSGIAAFENIEEDLRNAVVEEFDLKKNVSHKAIKLRENIELRNIHFSYPLHNKKVLNGLSLNIPLNQTIGIVGGSGSGKSTAIDILAGLINVTEGGLYVDGREITKENLSSWQDLIAIVSQNIYLADSSIRNNIALGLDENEIDDEKINAAIKLAQLEKFVADLPFGVYTNVGERGISLSGGQRQRIGIARAMYKQAEVLIFDEATSALDNITEKEIMKSLMDLSGKKTIIMIAHRLSTIMSCDVIYLIKDGRVDCSGKYNELLDKSEDFRKMSLINK